MRLILWLGLNAKISLPRASRVKVNQRSVQLAAYEQSMVGTSRLCLAPKVQRRFEPGASPQEFELSHQQALESAFQSGESIKLAR
jgi:hypothetical protein